MIFIKDLDKMNSSTESFFKSFGLNKKLLANMIYYYIKGGFSFCKDTEKLYFYSQVEIIKQGKILRTFDQPLEVDQKFISEINELDAL